MTEAEWLAATDPTPMLEQCRFTTRKVRLLGCACGHRIWKSLSKTGRQAIKMSEAYADGNATEHELSAAHKRVANDEFWDVGPLERRGAMLAVAQASAPIPVLDFHRFATIPTFAKSLSYDEQQQLFYQEYTIQITLLRDIFGNPFRPIILDPAWLTSTVVQLARGIYDDRAFDRMPILADALQDAGCDNATILDHCPGPGPHARGCWVVDQILGFS